jgi:hypothetical protein
VLPTSVAQSRSSQVPPRYGPAFPGSLLDRSRVQIRNPEAPVDYQALDLLSVNDLPIGRRFYRAAVRRCWINESRLESVSPVLQRLSRTYRYRVNSEVCIVLQGCGVRRLIQFPHLTPIISSRVLFLPCVSIIQYRNQVRPDRLESGIMLEGEPGVRIAGFCRKVSGF